MARKRMQLLRCSPKSYLSRDSFLGAGPVPRSFDFHRRHYIGVVHLLGPSDAMVILHDLPATELGLHTVATLGSVHAAAVKTGKTILTWQSCDVFEYIISIYVFICINTYCISTPLKYKYFKYCIVFCIIF